MKRICTFFGFLALATSCLFAADLEKNFQNPPPENQPWVYWYLMDGNLSREGITGDLKAMRDAGIGGAVFLEVKIVNTWNNRLAGDAALPVEQRHTSITAQTVKKGSPLLPSGLLGPVTLQAGSSETTVKP